MNLQNFSTNPFRRVDLEAQLDHTVNVADAPVLAVRPYTNNEHYRQVYFETNRIIRETFVEAGLPAPEQHLAVSNPAFFERQDGHSVAATH